MKTLYMFKGDLHPPIKAALEYPDGSIVNLEGCTVRFQLVEVKTNITVLDETANVLEPAGDGIVQYNWKTGETDLDKQEYKGRFAVTFADSKTQTFPRKDSFHIFFNEKEGV